MEKEVNCINTRAILDYVRRHNHGDLSDLIKNLDPEIDSLSNPENFLEDPNNWISCTVASKLYERARLILNDQMVAYQIAKYAIENTDLGFKSLIVKVFWSYKTALRHAQKINDRWNRSKKIEIIEIKRNEALIRLHWNPSMNVTKDLCLMNQGSYTYIPVIWGGKPLTLTEKRCYFHGDAYCEYHLRWPARNKIYEIYSRFFSTKSFLIETLREIEADKKIMERKYEEVNKLNVDLSQKIKQIQAIQDTGKAILSVLDLEQLLNVIMNTLSNVCKINHAIIMLVNEKKGCLEHLYATGFKNQILEEVKNYKVPMNLVSNILVRVINTGHPEYISGELGFILKNNEIILDYKDPSFTFVVPLITRSKVIGIIATDVHGPEGVPRETRETLDVFAPQIAIAIENARLYLRLQEQMMEIKRSHTLLSRAEKMSFIGNLAARLAHEIKNPMTAIGTFIQMLPHKFDDEEYRGNFLRIALEETNRVKRLISELLDLVNVKETKFELNNLHDLIDKMTLLISPQSNSKKINIVRCFDPDIKKIWLDSEKIKQAILNILSNAVDFTPYEGKINIITKKIDTEKGNSVSVEIRDNGTGISPEIRSKIFDPYFTTKHKSNMHSGTGLGLFIANQHIQDHGGTIEAKGVESKGAVFTLTLPVDPRIELE